MKQDIVVSYIWAIYIYPYVHAYIHFIHTALKSPQAIPCNLLTQLRHYSLFIWCRCTGNLTRWWNQQFTSELILQLYYINGLHNDWTSGIEFLLSSDVSQYKGLHSIYGKCVCLLCSNVSIYFRNKHL